MADYYWKGGEAGQEDNANHAANWVTTSGGSTKHTTLPGDGDNVFFDATATRNCDFGGASTFPSDSADTLAEFEIQSNFGYVLATGSTLTINLSGQLIIDKAASLEFTAATTFAFSTAPSISAYDSAGSATTKAFVGLSLTESPFVDDTSRSNTTYNFGSQNFTMIDGIYPNITGTGYLQAKSIFSNASRALHNTYGSVDMLAINGIGVTSGDYDIYDYDKQFYFEGALTAIADTFKFGHTTARFKAQGAAKKLPVNGERNTNAYGNDTLKTFYTDYHKVVIENGGSSNYWIISAGLTLDCNELVINDGGRLYGPSDGGKAATIKSVKRPTVRGDWNFRQITDGIYESVNDASNTSVYEGGTGRQTLAPNSIIYGQGMDQVGVLALGSAGDVLAVNSGATGIEWSSTGGTNIELDELSDVTITSAAEQEILRYDATAGEWVNETHDRQFIRVKAAEAVSKGDVVYIFDVHNANVVKVKKAKADSTSTMPAIGIMYETLALDAEGLAVVFGKANGIAANYTAGDTMYVSPTTAGALTDTKPTSGSHLIQNVGILMQAHASNASVKVTGVGRSNDIPNATITTNSADADYVYIDDGNVWKKITPANLGIGSGGGGGVSGSGTANQLTYWDGSSSITGSTKFTIDATAGDITATGQITGGDYILAGGGQNDLALTSASGEAITITPALGVNTGSISISEAADGDITITPHGTGKIQLDGLAWPNADGSNGQVLQTNGSGVLSFTNSLSNVVEDTTPQLGGNLDVNGNKIISATSSLNFNVDSVTDALQLESDTYLTTKLTLNGISQTSKQTNESIVANNAAYTMLSFPHSTYKAITASVHIKDTDSNEEQTEMITAQYNGSTINYTTYGQVYDGSAAIGELQANLAGIGNMFVEIQLINKQGATRTFEGSIHAILHP